MKLDNDHKVDGPCDEFDSSDCDVHVLAEVGSDSSEDDQDVIAAMYTGKAMKHKAPLKKAGKRKADCPPDGAGGPGAAGAAGAGAEGGASGSGAAAGDAGGGVAEGGGGGGAADGAAEADALPGVRKKGRYNYVTVPGYGVFAWDIDESTLNAHCDIALHNAGISKCRMNRQLTCADPAHPRRGE
eukprot:7433308-Pyramimonas_sp.AAC.1